MLKNELLAEELTAKLRKESLSMLPFGAFYITDLKKWIKDTIDLYPNTVLKLLRDEYNIPCNTKDEFINKLEDFGKTFFKGEDWEDTITEIGKKKIKPKIFWDYQIFIVVSVDNNRIDYIPILYLIHENKLTVKQKQGIQDVLNLDSIQYDTNIVKLVKIKT